MLPDSYTYYMYEGRLVRHQDMHGDGFVRPNPHARVYFKDRYKDRAAEVMIIGDKFGSKFFHLKDYDNKEDFRKAVEAYIKTRLGDQQRLFRKNKDMKPKSKRACRCK
jgi:hypothetical protein